MTALRFLLLFCTIFVLSNCVNKEKESMKIIFKELEKSKWQFEGYDNTPIANTNATALLNFEYVSGDTIRFGGQSFVNYYGGAFIYEDTLKTSEISSTLILGGDENRNQLENDFFSNLSHVKEIKTTQDKLYLTFKNAVTGLKQQMVFIKKIENQ
jgi:heat shock protein HslJ